METLRQQYEQRVRELKKRVISDFSRGARTELSAVTATLLHNRTGPAVIGALIGLGRIIAGGTNIPLYWRLRRQLDRLPKS